jgi:hypothetical protein
MVVVMMMVVMPVAAAVVVVMMVVVMHLCELHAVLCRSSRGALIDHLERRRCIRDWL